MDTYILLDNCTFKNEFLYSQLRNMLLVHIGITSEAIPMCTYNIHVCPFNK